MKGALSWPFMRLYLLTLLYFSANAILNIIIPLQGESWGASNTTIGVVMGGYLFTTMFFRPWAGHLIHKYGPIRMLRMILLIHGLALMLYTFTGLGGYLAARMLQGVATAFFSMALQMGIVDALPDKDRSQGISLYSLCSYMPGILGPLLALSIWQSEDHIFTIVMIVLALLTGGIGYSAKMENSKKQPKSEQSKAGSSVFHFFGQIVKNRDLFQCSMLMLSASIVFGAVTTFIPLYAKQVEGGNVGVFLMLLAGTVVIARFFLRKKIPSDGTWHSFFITGIMFTLAIATLCVGFSVTGGVFFFYAGSVFIGIAQALLYPTLTTYLTFVVPSERRNVFIGLFIATADLGVSMGGVVMGPIADAFSYSVMYMTCSLLALFMIFFAYNRRRIVS